MLIYESVYKMTTQPGTLDFKGFQRFKIPPYITKKYVFFGVLEFMLIYSQGKAQRQALQNVL